MAKHAVEHKGVAIRLACEAFRVSESCYRYLRKVKNFCWNHKRIYWIYRELELNLRIKPRRRLVRDKPEPLT
jgi:putative transposase